MLKHPPAVPEAIASAAHALLAPYLDLNALLNPKQANTPESGGPGKKYFSVKEAERFTGLSRYSLRRAVLAGDLEVRKLSFSKNSKVLIAVTELERWLNSKKQTGVNNDSKQQTKGV